VWIKFILNIKSKVGIHYKLTQSLDYFSRETNSYRGSEDSESDCGAQMGEGRGVPCPPSPYKPPKYHRTSSLEQNRKFYNGYTSVHCQHLFEIQNISNF